LDQSEAQAVADATAAANGDGRRPVLDVVGLQAGWGRKRVVFDVDIHIYEGEIVGILGHNGSGKSTTIKAILGTNPSQGGKVVYGGRDVTRAGSKSNVRSGMALIPSSCWAEPTSPTRVGGTSASSWCTGSSRSCASGRNSWRARCRAASSAW